MLSDPLTVTYNSVAKTLARRYAIPRASVSKRLSSSSYATSDLEFAMFSSYSLLGDGLVRSELLFQRIQQDDDANPFTGDWRPLPNRFGVIYEVNPLKFNTSTDIPLIRSALLSFVDSTMQNRLIAGEV